MSVRVFLFDDHEIVREGIRALLESEGLTVVGEAGTPADALARIPTTHPEVAVLDVRLPDGDGNEVCREIRSTYPEVACVLLTSFADDVAHLAAVMAGAAGYVLKQIRGRELVEGILAVAMGNTLIDPATTQRLVVEHQHTHFGEDEGRALTPREAQILELIAAGKTNREIGAQLYLAEKTVKNYVSNLLAKLGMGRRSEAAAYAARLQERRAQRFDRGS